MKLINECELERIFGGAASSHRGNGVILVDGENAKDEPSDNNNGSLHL